MSHTFQQRVSGSLAILCFAPAELIHGTGFIAAFVGGLLLGSSTRSAEICERIRGFGEAFGQQLILIVFMIFAMVTVPLALPHRDMVAWIYKLPSNYDYERGYSGYYDHARQETTGGYCAQYRVLTLQTNLYGVASGKLIWSMKSEVVDASQPRDVVDDQIELTIETLARRGSISARP